MSITERPRDVDDVSTRAQVGALVDELPDGVLVMTASGLLKSANKAFLEMVGRHEREVIGKPIEAIVAEEDMLQLVGVETMFREATRDASIIFTASDGSPRRLIVCSAKSADLKRILLTARIAGAVQEELASTTRWAASERERAGELALARDALAANNVALRAAQEDADAAYKKLQGEVAARERLEKELRLAQKLEGIGQLAAGVAHEINTPMQYVGDNVAFLERAFAKLSEHLAVADAALAGETAKSLEEARGLLDASRAQLKLKFLLDNVPKSLRDARSGILHVSSIVRAMKSFAHVDNDEKATGDINQALRDTLMVAQSEYKSVATVETDLGELPPVICFPGRLNQVFLNLLVNAAHAIAEAKPTAGGKICVASRAEDNVVIVTISDNGGGIPEAIQDKVFDQFFTTKPVGKGTGQGLSLARGIVAEAHGGTLSFKTTQGQGTAFEIRLPVDGRTKLIPPS
ncbi:MAG TPA: ATP-binding protein [Polyangiaceae bacterium]